MLYWDLYKPYMSIIFEFKRWKAVQSIVSGVNYHFVICVAICSLSYSFQTVYALLNSLDYTSYGILNTINVKQLPLSPPPRWLQHQNDIKYWITKQGPSTKPSQTMGGNNIQWINNNIYLGKSKVNWNNSKQLFKKQSLFKTVYSCSNKDLPLVCVLLCFSHFPVWCPGSGVVLDCIDSWSLPPYLLLNIFRYVTWYRHVSMYI